MSRSAISIFAPSGRFGWAKVGPVLRMSIRREAIPATISLEVYPNPMEDAMNNILGQGCEASRESKAGNIESSIRRVKESMESLETLLGRMTGNGMKTTEPLNSKTPTPNRSEFILWGEIANEMYQISERIEKSIAVLTENMI